LKGNSASHKKDPSNPDGRVVGFIELAQIQPDYSLSGSIQTIPIQSFQERRNRSGSMNGANCLNGMPCIIHELFHLSWYNKVDAKVEPLNVKKIIDDRSFAIGRIGEKNV
jgi:hypothetical protein